jgi:hypothetical protein
MNIKKEYNLTLEDQLNFRQYQLKINSKKYNGINALQFLLLYLPLLFIIFSSSFIFDYVVKMMGLIIAFGLIVYYILLNIFSEHINKYYFKKTYNKYDISENIKIIITENSIIDNSLYSEYKITPQWVHEFQENKDYIYLLGIYMTCIIIPKKYYSEEEIEMIKNIIGNNKVGFFTGKTATEYFPKDDEGGEAYTDLLCAVWSFLHMYILI